MRKRGFVGLLLFLILLASFTNVSATSIDEEFKKLANYAKDYETGNINYVQLLIYSSAARENMNEALGATGRQMGGILKQEQMRKLLGEPVEETKWVWMEREERETKLDEPVPVWKKIIFDGQKIQIRLNAWPSIFGKREFEEEEFGEDEKREQMNRELEDLEGKLVYRLNFEIEFKKPEEQLDVQSKIMGIQTLAQKFNSDPSSENAEALAKESVNAERTFESHFKQSGGKCENVMSEIFGTENKRRTQQLLVEEINFCEGDNFEIIARLEMCDECEWNWINLDFWIEGRGQGFKPEEGGMSEFSSKSFENMDDAQFEEEIGRIIDEVKQSCSTKDFTSINRAKSKLWSLNDAWSQKSNNVWEEVEKDFESQRESMTPERRQEFEQNYGWIKQEQEKRQKVKELSKVNYENRKQFYLSLFSGYDKKEYSFSQIEFEKRLIEEFREKGEEVCDNNKDDNQNEAIDCADEQCGGKICGKGKSVVQEGNETKDIETDFYCIEKQCKAREEMPTITMNVSNASVICQELPPIECPEGGRVFFSRYDNQTNCPVETSCLQGEATSCQVKEDCRQPACGVAECVENKCEVTELTECRELECVDGDERICESERRIVGICNNGFWETTGECEGEPEIRNETVVGNECLNAGDCGSNNVCNNGVCQVLPQVIITEPTEERGEEQGSEEETISDEVSQEQRTQETTPREERQEGEEAAQQNEEQTSGSTSESQSTTEPESSSEPTTETTPERTQRVVAGNSIFNFVGVLFSKMKSVGAVITGFEGEEAPQTQDTAPPTNEGPSQEQPQTGTDSGTGRGEFTGGEENREGQDPSREQPPIGPGSEPPNREGEIRVEENREHEGEDRDRERREEGDREDEGRREEENKERCKKECERPCVEKCIREECGEGLLECVVDEAKKKCEGTCEAEDSCVEKCMKGGDWWKEFENKDEHKEERGVFQVGGSCRTSKGRTEGFIWFGGWGEPFQQIQPLKNKYYSGGQADWCRYDFENLKKQRQEFEQGFNQEFVTWFFEKHLANSAENWEQSVSGIFELYWKDVENSREMANRMQCLGTSELPSTNLINVKYDTEYGSIEFWEEIKTVKLPEMDEEVQIVSPYMKMWIFPPKEFIIYEMKQAMKNHEFPGPPEEKLERENEEGPTAEEREMIKQDQDFMRGIREVSEKYGGNLDAVIQFKDYETNEVVFNLYAQVNENDIMKIKPMLPEEVPAEDVRVEVDFALIYEMIYDSEKEMRGGMIESPPWDKKVRPMQKIKEITDGIKMYFKLRKIINSAKITPAESEDDVKNLFKKFMSMMMEGDRGGGPPEGAEEKDIEKEGVEKGVWDSKETVTGEIILG